MSPSDANPITPLPRPTDDPGGPSGGTLIAVGGGLVIGLLIVFFGVRQERFAGLDAAEIAIRINEGRDSGATCWYRPTAGRCRSSSRTAFPKASATR